MSEHRTATTDTETPAQTPSGRTRRVAADRRPVRRVYETPVWVPEQKQAAEPGRHRGPLLPEQSAPGHDHLAPQAAAGASLDVDADVELATATIPDAVIPDAAHWVGACRGRRALRTLLAGLVAFTGWAAYAAFSGASTGGYDLVAIGAVGVVGAWVMLATTQPMVVDLAGSELRIRTGRGRETFDLASPFLVVRVRGIVGSPSWSLALERTDGTEVVIGSRSVRSSVLYPIVMHHQATAQALRDERAARFLR